jgi:hypothetical protein
MPKPDRFRDRRRARCCVLLTLLVLPVARAGAQPRAEERDLAELTASYRAARTAQAAGRPDEAEALLARQAPRTGVGAEGSAAREANARLLALRATLLAARTDAPDALFRAEAMLAAAIAEEPRIADHWHQYLGVRRRREREVIDARLRQRELVTYDLRAAGLSRRPLTLVFPVRDDWAYLRAVAAGRAGRPDEALRALADARRTTGGGCHLTQSEAQLHLQRGDTARASAALRALPDACPAARSPTTLALRARLAAWVGDERESRRLLREAWAADPGEVPALVELARLDATVGGDVTVRRRALRDSALAVARRFPRRLERVARGLGERRRRRRPRVGRSRCPRGRRRRAARGGPVARAIPRRDRARRPRRGPSLRRQRRDARAGVRPRAGGGARACAPRP